MEHLPLFTMYAQSMPVCLSFDRQVQDFCMEVGPPVTLAEIGITEEAQIQVIAEKACAEGESIHNMVADVTPDQLYAAIKAADALGRERKAE